MASGLGNPFDKEDDGDGEVSIVVESDVAPVSHIDPKTGALIVEQPDGSVIVHLVPPTPAGDDGGGFYENLADKISSGESQRIVEQLLQGIDADDQSREDWLKTRAQGIEMLGFRLEEPRTDAGTTSAPLEGMSVVRHTLLPEAVIRFQANAVAELLPASGPVKVRNDQPNKPAGANEEPWIGHNGGPTLDDDEGLETLLAQFVPQQPAPPPPPPQPGFDDDNLADALEHDLNHYLTVVDKAYRSDTARMLFDVGFGGCGFKKIYNDPIKRRPVSRSVDAKDLIVSNEICDLEDAGRITHRVRMRKSLMKRMQLVGAYSNIELGQPSPEYNEADRKVQEVQGFNPQPTRPEDYPYIIDECYCELDIAGFEHKEKGKPSGLSLPWKVSIERTGRKLLELRRNWREDDETYAPRRVFVKYNFVEALGFYSIGLLQILGNADRALTAAWREMLDAGMFSSFPGFLYAKNATRQTTNEMRVPPGGGLAIETGGQPIQQAVMPLPYRDPGPGLLGLVQRIEEMGQRIGGTAELPVGEGNMDAPVGTTLALIEQATKVIASVHVGLHAAQSEEFQLLKERFQEDPEAFWRFNRKPARKWEVEMFLKALDDYDLVPAADPNTASHMHRIMKAVAIKQLQAMNPQLYDAKMVDTRILNMIGFSNPEELFAPPMPPGAPPAIPPDPNKMAELNMKMQLAQVQHEGRMAELAVQLQEQQQANAEKTATTQMQAAGSERDRQMQAQMTAVESADRAADRASRERVAQARTESEQARLAAQTQLEHHKIQTNQESEATHLEAQQKTDAAKIEVQKAAVKARRATATKKK